MQESRSNLPALRSSSVAVLELERAFACTRQKKRLETIWTNILVVIYQETKNSLRPVIRLVDNQDLSLIKSSKLGFAEVILSLVDVWDGQGKFPSLAEIDQIILDSGKEPAGIAEMALFAKAINNQPIAVSSGHLLAIAPRDRLQRGDVIQCPSVSQDKELGVLVGLTYDWVIKRHHVYALVISNL